MYGEDVSIAVSSIKSFLGTRPVEGTRGKKGTRMRANTPLLKAVFGGNGQTPPVSRVMCASAMLAIGTFPEALWLKPVRLFNLKVTELQTGATHP